jgi:glycerol-3-phosphate dehydrogenase
MPRTPRPPSVGPFDVAVVGAGVVGLAIAREYARDGARVVVLDREPGPGREQSTHNSGVVHSGLMAAPGTLRARLNVEGNRRLYDLAAELGVAAEACGTIAVALREEDLARLQQYEQGGRANLVPGVRWLTDDELRAREPRLAPCVGALFAPTGGRVDAVGLVAALERAVRADGGAIRYEFDVVSASETPHGWRVTALGGASVEAALVVNSAGIGAGRVARLFGGAGRRIYPCLGEYARVLGERSAWLSTMVYGFPPPGYPGIGVHLTRTTRGELLIGPTATYLPGPEAPALALTPLSEFAALASAYLPGLTERDLAPVAPGVRAKTVPPGSADAFGEFEIVEEPAGSGAIHLFGIESPGLTASPAIGAYVRDHWPDAVR